MSTTIAAARARPHATPDTTPTPDRLDGPLETWLADLVDRGLQPTTVKFYRSVVRSLLEHVRACGHGAWGHVGPKTLDSFFAAARERGLGDTTLLMYQQGIRRFFAYLDHRGIPARSALQWLGPPRRDARTCPPPPPEAARLIEVVGQFCDFKAGVERRSQNTVESYRRCLTHLALFVSAAGLQRWREVPTTLLIAYLSELYRLKLSVASTQHARSVLRNFILFLYDRDERPNDWHRMGRAPKKPQRMPEVLERDEVARLIESVNGRHPLDLRDRALMEVAYASGVRVSELRDLTIQDLNMEDLTARVIGKGDKQRIVVFGEPARAALEDYLANGRPRLAAGTYDPSDWVFLNHRGGQMSRVAFGRALKVRAKAAGITQRIYAHLLRHTCATHLLAGGANLRAVQELLGHASIVTTQIYTHLSANDLREAFRGCHPRSRMSAGHVKPGRPDSSRHGGDSC